MGFLPLPGIMEIRDESDADYGLSLITADGSTTLTPVDFTGIADPDDFVILSAFANNFQATTRQLDLYSDSAGTKHIHIYPDMGTASGNAPNIMATLLVRIRDPATSLYFIWSGGGDRRV